MWFFKKRTNLADAYEVDQVFQNYPHLNDPPNNVNKSNTDLSSKYSLDKRNKAEDITYLHMNENYPHLNDPPKVSENDTVQNTACSLDDREGTKDGSKPCPNVYTSFMVPEYDNTQLCPNVCSLLSHSPVAPCIFIEDCDIVNKAKCFSCSEESDISERLKQMKADFPEHIKDMFITSCAELTEEQQLKFGRVLIEYQDIFSKDELDIGLFEGLEHSIETGDNPPVKLRMRRTPLGFQDEEKEHLEKLLKADIVQPSVSEWASVPVLVRKADGGTRWCLDFRKLNAITKKDTFPLPNIKEFLESLHGSVYFSTLDMSMGYHQIKIKNEDQDKTSFITKHGTFSYKRLPFGLCNSGATFSRVIALVLRGVPPEVAKAYLDDIIILGRNFTEHLNNKITVFEKFDENHLKFKPKKCLFFRRQTKYLGRVISDKGISVDPAKTECIQNWPLPKDKTQLQKFQGFCNYHREFIKSYAEISSVLYDACTKFVWTDMHTKAFNDLQRALTSPACLAYPTEEGIYVLDTDASNDTIGAELLQVQEGVERTIAYASYKLLKQQKNYCTTRKELLSVVAFTRYFRHYLIGQSKFYVRTDHSSLAWLTRFKEPQGQLARWLEELAQYNMEILHRKGQKHIDADSLSRIPDNLDPCDCYSAGEKLQDLPCKGCKFCERAHKQWSRFLTDVDDIVPLSRNQHSAKFDVHIVNDMNKLIKDGGSTEVFTVQHPRDTIDFTSSLGFTSEELSTLQWRDPNLLPIMMYARDGTELSQQELELHGPAVQSMWLCRKYFLLRDGVLHYRWLGRSDREYVLVVPKSTVDLVISLCHDDKTAGHLSHEKTLFRLKQRFFWYNMSLQCLLYCRGCEVCNRSKKLHQKNKAPMQSYQVGYPGLRIHMDILGPFVTSSDGNKYVLTIVDQFSKWVTMTVIFFFFFQRKD